MEFEDQKRHNGHDIGLIVLHRTCWRDTGAALSYPSKIVVMCRACNVPLFETLNPIDPNEYYGEKVRIGL